MIYERRGDTSRHDAELETTTMAGLEWDAADRDETWMVSYADIISTLLAMVVLLFGRMAMTNATPIEPVTETHPALAIAERALEPPVPAPIEPAAPSPIAEPIAEPMAEPVVEPIVESIAAPTAEPTFEQTPEDRLALLIEARFDGRIKAEQRSEGLVLTIPEVALFDSARAALQNSASPLLTELAATLQEAGDAQIAVEGHTDDRPLQGGEFGSNWDLAAARANAVTRYLLQRGFDPRRLHSVSFADTRPVADNETPEGRAANRRVELKIEFVAADASSGL